MGMRLKHCSISVSSLQMVFCREQPTTASDPWCSRWLGGGWSWEWSSVC